MSILSVPQDGYVAPGSAIKVLVHKYTHPEKFNKEQYTFLCEVEKTTIKYVCMLHMLKTPEGKCQQP